MLHQCRGDVSSAFLNLLDENQPPPKQENVMIPKMPMKPYLQSSSRSSSPYSTGSKRSAETSDPEEEARPKTRHRSGHDQKKRVLPNVTVGFAFRNNQNDLVSLRLRLSPGSDKAASSTNTDVESRDYSDVELEPETDDKDEAGLERKSSKNSDDPAAPTTLRRSQRSTKAQSHLK